MGSNKEPPQSNKDSVCVLSHSVVSDSAWPHGLWPTRLLCPWDSPGKNTGVGCHALLQGIFPNQDQTQVSHSAGGFFTIWATREALYHINNIIYLDAQIVQEFISSWLLCLFKTLNSHENISNSSASAPDLLQLLSLTPFSSSEKPDLHYPQYMFWFWYAWSPC